MLRQANDCSTNRRLTTHLIVQVSYRFSRWVEGLFLKSLSSWISIILIQLALVFRTLFWLFDWERYTIAPPNEVCQLGKVWTKQSRWRSPNLIKRNLFPGVNCLGIETLLWWRESSGEIWTEKVYVELCTRRAVCQLVTILHAYLVSHLWEDCRTSWSAR